MYGSGKCKGGEEKSRENNIIIEFWWVCDKCFQNKNAQTDKN